MIMARIVGGIGNQLFQYAAGRRLAHKLNTDLKLDLSRYKVIKSVPYVLNQFNITATVATAEEVEEFKSKYPVKVEQHTLRQIYMPEVMDYPDNIYLQGFWENEKYFADIADIIREEFTLKNPLTPTAEAWKQKILDTECSASLHVRRGDFLRRGHQMYAVPNTDYHYECIKRLKQQCPDFTLFVFSNDLNWCREHLVFDVPTEFVSGDRKDFEDLYLMSLCKHNILSNSTFSFWGTWLNQNPDKKVFFPIPSNLFGKKGTYRHLSIERNENSPFDFDKWIRVPFDMDKRLNLFLEPTDKRDTPVNVKLPPIFSLVLVVNNDSETIAETLDSILNQDFKYYEVIIIDNASTDDSVKICREAVAGRDNVVFRHLYSKVKISEAYNVAINMAQGKYLYFLKGNTRLLADALTAVYLAHGNQDRDIINSFAVLTENADGKISFGDQKFSAQRDDLFKKEKRGVVMSTNGYDAAKFLLNQKTNSFLGTKAYNRDFLKKNGLQFDEFLADDEAEFFFQLECFFKSKYLMHVANAFYIAPRK